MRPAAAPPAHARWSVVFAVLLASAAVEARKARKRTAKPEESPAATARMPEAHLLHDLPADWETGTLRELRAHARYAGIGAEQLDDEPDAIVGRVRRAKSAQSAGFGAKSTFDREHTDKFVRALMPTEQKPMGDPALALQIIVENSQMVDPNARFPFDRHLVPVLSHVVRVYLFHAYSKPGGEGARSAYALIQALVEAGAATTARDHSCVPVLTYAAFFKSVRLVQLLVDHGARCDTAMDGPKTRGYSPLHAAIESDPRSTMATLARLYETIRHGAKHRTEKAYWYEAFPRPIEYTGYPSGHMYASQKHSSSAPVIEFSYGTRSICQGRLGTNIGRSSKKANSAVTALV